MVLSTSIFAAVNWNEAAEAPEADYESMSAEQFRRLKKQLSRAALDGRKIRL